MPSEPVWLTEQQVIRINERLVEQTGEPHLLLHPGLLSSGMARPVNRWAYGEQDIANLAGILLLGIGMNHPFQQGNKRTALTAAKVFLQFNGYSFVAPDGEPLGAFVERSIIGMISESAFLKAMRSCAILTEEWQAFQRG
ncbi:type II toxin-antitoxin system death-on-curing family toxin [Bradyrhizobium sp.]|uniref:type II toxin-antitoxin system death-on-curing family toxin n=1 Tax=Bradyrhizobium sp. TaxID=376 RepID=UPI001ECF5A03|nr:type II toxin-antitoxin system death-on-curing family toxin [Bradyrhizobium sp.]MBV9985412.1 type II toxin-antitoxin system death-on-curing family toxin [Bradyrhizobium sp.]